MSEKEEQIRMPSREEVQAAFQKLRKSLATFQQKAIKERHLNTLDFLDHMASIEEFVTEMERITDIHERAFVQAVKLNIALLQKSRRSSAGGGVF